MTRFARIIIAAIGLTTAAGCVGRDVTDHTSPPVPPWESTLARDTPLTGQIRATRTGASLTPDALLDRLAAADFILLGERHDNPDHHRLQAWIVERLLARGKRAAIAFEMIDSDQAPRLSAYIAASPPQDAAGLGDALDWSRSGWPDWRHYRPIAATAMAHGLPILAADLPAGLARVIAKDGIRALPAPLAARLQLDGVEGRADMQPILAAHAAEMQAAHCGQLPERSLTLFAVAQYARDAHMARVMADQWRGSNGFLGVILIAGGGHARTDRGVPLHLARMAPEARIVALDFVEAADDSAGESELASLPYDVVWFTARVESEDPCAKMTAQPSSR